jgi:hypothetical protein
MALTMACLFTVWAGSARAQVVSSPEPVQRGTAPTEADTNCAGMVTNETIPYDLYVISGPEADPQTVYSWGQYVYLNKGSADGMKIGDEFMVLRQGYDFLHVQFYDEEHRLSNRMGQQWIDVGRVRVVLVQPKVSIARITYACTDMERGDYVRPAVNYPAPPFKSLKDLDRFAPPSGKSVGRVVRGKNYLAVAERGQVVYVNLTDAKPGDYIRFFRPTARKDHAIYQLGGMSDHVEGFGHTPIRWRPEDVPREVLGEGVVLRTTPTSASVMVFNALLEIHIGSYAEIE